MQIENGKVVSFHYKVFGEDGAMIEETGEQPMLALHGADNMIAGVEKALTGRSAGDHFEVTVTPEEGYGVAQPANIQRISAKYLRHAGKLRPGMQVPVHTDQGQRWVTVLKVGLKTVDVDANHPLAGRTLRFVIDVVDVRDATEEEKSHGHAHGPGGHQH